MRNKKEVGKAENHTKVKQWLAHNYYRISEGKSSCKVKLQKMSCRGQEWRLSSVDT